MRRRNFWASDELWNRLKERAWSDRTTVADAVRSALEAYLGEKPSGPPAGVVKKPAPTPSRVKPPIPPTVRNNTVAELFAEKKK